MKREIPTVPIQTRTGGIMKQDQKPGLWLTGLTVIIVIAIIAIAGCTDSTGEQQGQVNTAGNVQTEHTAATTAVATKPATVQETKKITTPVSTPVKSNGVIEFDPIPDRRTGVDFVITGTTSLPAGTNVFWDIRPDTGTIPTGIDMNSQMGIMANNQVIKGSGTANQVSLSVEAKSTKDLVTGKYVVVVVSLKGDPMTTDPSTGTLAGYTYVTLK
jgi:hypothetical protein